MDGRRDPGSIRQSVQGKPPCLRPACRLFRSEAIRHRVARRGSRSVSPSSGLKPLPLILKTRKLRPRKSTSSRLIEVLPPPRSTSFVSAPISRDWWTKRVEIVRLSASGVRPTVLHRVGTLSSTLIVGIERPIPTANPPGHSPGLKMPLSVINPVDIACGGYVESGIQGRRIRRGDSYLAPHAHLQSGPDWNKISSSDRCSIGMPSPVGI